MVRTLLKLCQKGFTEQAEPYGLAFRKCVFVYVLNTFEFATGKVMNFCQKFSLITSIVFLLILALFLNRISQAPPCNSHSSLAELHLFTHGRLLKVPHCSPSQFFGPSKWSLREAEIIRKVISFPQFSSPILLTIDMENTAKVHAIEDYFWIGSDYIDNYFHPLGQWLEIKSSSLLLDPSSEDEIAGMMGLLSYKVLRGRDGYFNWSKLKQDNFQHLKEALITEKEYCKNHIWNLDHILDCAQLTEEKGKNISKGILSVLLLEIVYSYFKKLPILERIDFVYNLKRSSKVVANPTIQWREGMTYSQLSREMAKVVAESIKLFSTKRIIKNAILAEVMNEFSLFTERDYLVVSSPHNNLKKTQSTEGFLFVNTRGQIFSRYGDLLNIELGDLYFDRMLIEGTQLNTTDVVYKKARFTYLIDSELDFKEIKNLGVTGFLLKNKNIAYAKVHIPSLEQARIKNLQLKSLAHLAKLLGWKEVNWSQQKKSYLPTAQIDGVLSYR